MYFGALAIAAGIMSLVSWESLGKALISTTFGILGTIALVFAGISLGTALTGPQFGIAMAGLLLGAALFTVGVVAFAIAIGLLQKFAWTSDSRPLDAPVSRRGLP